MMRSRSKGCRFWTGITLLLVIPERASSSFTSPRSPGLALQNTASSLVGWSRT